MFEAKKTHRIRQRKVGFARELRRRMTPEEGILWEELRGRRFHRYKFRRQVPLGSFIADFLCIRLKLIIEVDGPIHDRQHEYDLVREEQLRAQGYCVLHFTNDEIQNQLPRALKAIVSYIHKSHPTFPLPPDLMNVE